jgi:cell wall-associated NlpC family hydrolase
MTWITAVRRLASVLGLVLLAATALPGPVAAASEPRTETQRVLAIARNQLGDRYSWAATGPSSFDCSGLAYYVFREAALLDRIGGKRRTVAGYHSWFRNRDAVSRGISTARPGDVLVWGSDKHTGIYVGDNYAISALVNPYGVTLHRVDRISLRLTAVLRVKMER